MNKKAINQSNIRNLFEKRSFQIGILVYFFIISIVMFWPIHNATHLFAGHDIRFHLTRIEELYHALASGSFQSYISTFTGNRLGIANGIFYPNLFIYLFAGVKFLVHDPIKAVYVGVWIINLLTLLISYFTYKAYSKSSFKAFIFANIYGLSTYRYIDILTRFDLGEYFALMILPVVLWSFYEITYHKQYKDWPWLGLSMAGILYSHLLTLAILTAFLAIVFVISLIGGKIASFKATFKSYVMAVISFILLGAGFLVSFIETYRMGPIKHPWASILSDRAYDPSGLFNASLNNSLLGCFSLGIMSIVIIVVGLLVFKKLNWLNKDIFIIAGVLLVLSTKLFPWGYFQRAPFTLLQFPFRLLILANILLAIVGTEVFSLFDPKKLIFLLVPFMILTQIASVSNFANIRYTQPHSLLTKPMKRPYQRLHSKHPLYDLKSYKILTQYGNNYSDYIPWPKENTDKQNITNFKKMTMHPYYYNGKKQGTVKNIKSIANGVIMKLKMKRANSKVTLPFYLYNIKNYQLTVNGKAQKPRYNKYHNLIASLKKGKNTIQIEYVPAKSQLVASCISIISLIGICCLPLYRKWRKNSK